MTRESYINAGLTFLLVLVPFWAWSTGQAYILTLCTKVAILALAGVGLNIALGLGGLVSFGHAAFFGIGGYAMGILASHAQAFDPIMDWPILIEGTKSMPVIWLVAMLASSLAALLIGALSLRTSGVYFIMITLAFGQMLYYFTIGWPAYGGEDGLSIYVRNSFPGLNTLVPVQFLILSYFISPTMFSWHTSGEIMIFVILGGVGRLYGPVAGAALFILLEHLLGGVSDYWKIFLGALLLAVVLFARGGLIGTLAGREVAHD